MGRTGGRGGSEGGGRSSTAEGERIASRPGGGVQVVTSGRLLFDTKRRDVFLEHLAATANVKRSASEAGVTAQCVYQRRMKDARFREAWGRALEQGYARIEMMLVEHAAATRPIEVAGDLELGEEPIDTDLARHLLREHKKGLAGIRRDQGMNFRIAEWTEVEAYFIKRLKALKARTESVRASAREGRR